MINIVFPILPVGVLSSVRGMLNCRGLDSFLSLLGFVLSNYFEGSIVLFLGWSQIHFVRIDDFVLLFKVKAFRDHGGFILGVKVFRIIGDHLRRVWIPYKPISTSLSSSNRFLRSLTSIGFSEIMTLTHKSILLLYLFVSINIEWLFICSKLFCSLSVSYRLYSPIRSVVDVHLPVANKLFI